MVRKQNCVIWIQAVSLYTQKTNDIHKNIGEDVETRFDISNYELDKAFPERKKKQKK